MRFPSITRGMETPIGHFELTGLPGCNQIAVSHHAFIVPAMRGKGLGHITHRTRLDLIKQLGYDYALCTTDAANEPQRKILEAAGWNQLDQFKNSETNHEVIIWGKTIKPSV